jgi:Domain of unknown function (DUF1707)
MGPAELRCSDADRDRVADLLRGHAAVGRLTVDELDERIAAALSAKTNGELSVLLRDLPTGPPPRPVPARKPPKVPGRTPFAETWRAPSRPEYVMGELMTYVAPPLARHGFTLTERGSHRLVFVRERRPVWTILVAIGLFPLGLLALLHQQREQVVIDLQAKGDDTLISASGIAPLDVRRAFATLEA